MLYGLLMYFFSLIKYTYFLFSGVCEAVLITQWPSYIVSNSRDRAQMHCYQNDTSYDYLYWYRQLKGGEIQLIVYLIAGSANPEPDFKSGYEAVKLSNKQWSLNISSVQEKDEAVYLCAVSHTVQRQTSGL